jgi:PHD/YefM family antitoxin component YafN of YafNO toxin-antitoxin module
MVLMMNIQTVSYLKANASNLELDKPLHVTQNGREVYVVQDATAYHEQQETIALLKLINLSERSLIQRGEISLDEAFDV